MREAHFSQAAFWQKAGEKLSFPRLSFIRKKGLQEKQRVVETGPYAAIRHPMYAAFLLMFFSWPLALGSLYAFIPAIISALLLVERTMGWKTGNCKKG